MKLSIMQIVASKKVIVPSEADISVSRYSCYLKQYTRQFVSCSVNHEIMKLIRAKNGLNCREMGLGQWRGVKALQLTRTLTSKVGRDVRE